jgi:hypothetical protein
MENKQDQTTPTPSTTANGARAGQKPDASAQEDLSLDHPEKRLSKSDEDLAEYDSHEQAFGSDDFLANDQEEQSVSKRDQKYAATLKALEETKRH